MELLDLQIIVAVADTGSISGAAARLVLGQPAVSMRIKALEAELGQPLLVRGRRGVQLTVAGERLAGGARRTLELVQATREAVQETHQRPQLLIGAPSSIAAQLLPAVVEHLAADVDVLVTTDHSHVVLQRLVDGALDAGIVLGGTIPGGFVASALQPIPIVAVTTPTASPGSGPLALTALRGRPISWYNFSYDAQDLRARLTAAAGPLHGTSKVDPLEMARYFALRGHVTFVPEIAVAAELAAGSLVRLDFPELPPYYQEPTLVHRARKQLPPGITLLRQALGVGIHTK